MAKKEKLIDVKYDEIVNEMVDKLIICNNIHDEYDYICNGYYMDKLKFENVDVDVFGLFGNVEIFNRQYPIKNNKIIIINDNINHASNSDYYTVGVEVKLKNPLLCKITRDYSDDELINQIVLILK